MQFTQSGDLIKRLVVEANQLLGGQRSRRVGASLIVAEFNLSHRGRQQLNHRPHLPAHQAMLGRVPQQGNNGKKFQLRHKFSTLKDKASDKSRSAFASQDDPGAANARGLFTSLQLKIYYVTNAIQ